MKKVATAMALCMGLSVMAQNTPVDQNLLDVRAPGIPEPQYNGDHPNVNRSPSVTGKGKTAAILWSEDFATPFATSPNGAWVTSGANGNLVTRDLNGPDSLLQFGWGPIPSPTASNGFAIMDWYNKIPDATGFATSPAVGILTSPTIDLGGKTNVYMSFYQQIFHCCNLDLQVWVEVSTDGGATWPAANRFLANPIDRNDRHWNLGLGYYFEFDMYPMLVGAANTNNVKIRFNWTSNTTDANGQFSNYYFWMFDDIVIADSPRHKLTFTDAGGAPAHDIIFDGDGANSKTGRFTQFEAKPITFDSNLYNFGSEDQTGVDLKVEIYDATNTLVGSVQSNNSSLLLKGDTLEFDKLTTDPWTPPADGLYRFVYTAISDSIPGHPGAEAVRDTFNLIQTDSLIALHFGTFGNNIGTAELGDDGGALATRYTFTHPTPGDSAEIWSIEIDYSTATAAGGDIQIDIHDTTGFTFTGGFGAPALISRAFTLGADDDNGAVVNYDMTTNGDPLEIPNGTYYISVTMFSNAGANRIAIANDKTFNAPGLSSIMFNTSQSRWFTGFNDSETLNAPFISVKTHPVTISLDEVLRIPDVKLYPNPTQGRMSVEVAQGGTFTVELLTLTGQVVSAQQITTNGNERIDLDYSDVAKGTYLLKLNNDEYRKTTRVVLY